MRGSKVAIVNYMAEKGSITSKEAFEEFGVTRLAACVHDLRKMGYNTRINTSRRHEILDAAITQYGKRRVVDMLQFFIDMRKNQTRNYSYAISIWSDDIHYIINS